MKRVIPCRQCGDPIFLVRNLNVGIVTAFNAEDNGRTGGYIVNFIPNTFPVAEYGYVKKAQRRDDDTLYQHHKHNKEPFRGWTEDGKGVMSPPEGWYEDSNG